MVMTDDEPQWHISDPINDDDNDVVDYVLVDKDDDDHDVLIDVDDDDDNVDDDDDNDDYVDAMYDILEVDIQFSSIKFE